MMACVFAIGRLRVGATLRASDVIAALTGVPGVRYVKFDISTTEFSAAYHVVCEENARPAAHHILCSLHAQNAVTWQYTNPLHL